MTISLLPTSGRPQPHLITHARANSLKQHYAQIDTKNIQNKNMFDSYSEIVILKFPNAILSVLIRIK